MSDYISREKIIDFGERQLKHLDDGEAYRRLAAFLNAIPAADVVEVKRGKWIPGKEWTGIGAFRIKEMVVTCFICPECGRIVDVSEGDFNFCPNCGADMR